MIISVSYNSAAVLYYKTVNLVINHVDNIFFDFKLCWILNYVMKVVNMMYISCNVVPNQLYKLPLNLVIIIIAVLIISCWLLITHFDIKG